ncbi:hypothetical protein EDC04DRAFT_2565521 [Pisolithus marmoratus]|nr:hypothetical protein EDC04DRAFT_2565521 [Pisolithus marmoratus]
MRALLEKIRVSQKDGSESRVTGKGKGKEIITRFDGEVIEGEPEPVPKDPRKVPGFRRRPGREAFHEVKYEYDQNSTGPPPPIAILVTNISPLTPTQYIRQAFARHGKITSFEPQIDMETGTALGIVFIRYQTHEEAKQCVERANGKKLNDVVGASEGGELKVVFDGQGAKLKAVLKELHDRKKRAREEKRRKERETKVPQATSTPTSNSGHTPASNPNWRMNHSLPPRPAHIPLSNGRSSPSSHHRGKKPPPPPVLTKARMNNAFNDRYTGLQEPVPSSTHSSSSTPIHVRARSSYHSHRHDRSRSPRTRSPSPISRRPGHPSSRHQGQREAPSSAVIEALTRNGFDHVRIDLGSGAMGSVDEEDVRAFVQDFKIESVLRDRGSWYVTFRTADSARRAAMVLNSSGRTLVHHSVSVIACPPPSQPAPQPSAKVALTNEETVQHAEQTILRELKALLEKDITERIVGVGLRRLVVEEKAKAADAKIKEGADATTESKPTERRGLKGLSFRKPGKRGREDETKDVVPDVQEVTVVSEPQPEVKSEPAPLTPPKKKRKKVVVEPPRMETPDTGIPSEDEGSTEVRKRLLSEEAETLEEPIKKRAKTDEILDDQASPKKTAVKKKVPKKKVVAKEVIEDILLSETLEYPPTVELLTFEPSPRPLTPVAEIPPSPTRPPDPLKEGLCEDDEDLYFARLVISGDIERPRSPSPPPDAVPPFRKHITGSARTEGYYKISHAEKSAYVAQYSLRSTIANAAPAEPAPQLIVSSRSNRANARRRAQGLEEINQVQRAVALSKGETAVAELTLKFNQLQTRKKHLRFARSPIHDWGLYAMERIARGEMVIEYVGEIIRAAVADKREKLYERQGIGSSYLFRIDEDLVVDATKKGNLGRLINHSCDPNCTAKIITISGEKKIVIYAKQDIELGDEITYDYHFPIEQDKIPCLCGSAKCRGYLN